MEVSGPWILGRFPDTIARLIGVGHHTDEPGNVRFQNPAAKHALSNDPMLRAKASRSP